MSGKVCLAQLALTTFLLPLFVGSAPHGSFAAPNKEQYDLQERCGKRAAELFKREYGSGISNTEDGQSMSIFENHYSPKFNKCFMLLTTTFFGKKGGKLTGWRAESLVGVNENKDYGEFQKLTINDIGKPVADSVPFVCQVKETVCYSEVEWRELLKTYMEDAE